MKPRCRAGHTWNVMNTRWITTPTKRFRQCRACHADRQRLKYRTDPAYREAERSRTRANYHARMEHADGRV